MIEKVSKQSTTTASSSKSQTDLASQESLNSKRGEDCSEQYIANEEGLNPLRFNPLALRFKKLKHSSQEGTEQVRTEAREYEKIARIALWRVKNRGRGDTAVNGMIYASRQLLNITRRIRKKMVTPKLVYEFRYAKAEFEKAKKMSVATATKLPYAYHKVEIRKRREEEEDRIIPILHEEDEYGKLK